MRNAEGRKDPVNGANREAHCMSSVKMGVNAMPPEKRQQLLMGRALDRDAGTGGG